MSDLGQKFAKITNRPFKKTICQKKDKYLQFINEIILKHFVYGNGESRKGFKVSNYGGVSWGCNAIYRDTPVDNLVVVDYGMQGEVYDSDYVKQYKCWFTDWNPVPSDPFMLESFNHDFKEEDRHTYGFDLGTCVINGSHENSCEQ